MLTPMDFVAIGGSTHTDTIFQDPSLSGDFQFSPAVSKVFPDMIGRSVPGYWENVDWIGVLAQEFIEPGAVIYDLGCSLGAIGWSIDRNLSVDASILAVDNSEAMIETLGENLKRVETNGRWNIRCADVAQISFLPCSVQVLHYCLQFVPLTQRASLLSSIFLSLKDGGALFLSEKIAGEDQAGDDWLRRTHHHFKQRMGYSEREIEAKAKSIARMMPIEPASHHEQRLEAIGFSKVIRWRQSLNFCSWIAIK